MNSQDIEMNNGTIKEEEMKKEPCIRATPVADYATATMSQSLVTGVSNIVGTKNKFRKFFKTAVLLSCTAGFFYQATAFVQFILTYPSVVDIEVYVPNKFIRPAYTICNNNGIKRTKFCSKYPERCYVPPLISDFCNHYKFFCSTLEDKKNFTIIRPEFHDYEKEVTFEELKELGHDSSSIVTIDYHNAYEETEELEGPLLMRKEDGVFVTCYTRYLRVNSSLDAREREKPSRLNKIIDEFTFNAEPNEVFVPERFSGMLFNLHSPFTLEDPFQEGILIRLQRTYIVHLRLEEEHLLPYPYSHNCMNYTKEWLDRGRIGARSQEACIEKCELDLTFEDCNCTFAAVYYPSDGPFCTRRYGFCSNMEKVLQMDKEFNQCVSQCKDDCKKIKYHFDHQQRLNEINPYSEQVEKNISDEKYRSNVKVIASDAEVFQMKYRPQYQNLEVFSNLGGFIGAWLGVSLVAVIDLFEAFTMIGYFAFLKKRSMKRTTGQ